MDPVHLHLLLNHWPILGTLIGLLLLVSGYLLREGRRWLTRAALVTFIAGAVIAAPTNLTGEQAEHKIEHLPGVSEHMIEEHEESADAALWACTVLGAVALVALLLERRDHRYTRVVMLAVLLLAIATAALMVRTGNEGGKIRRPDLRGEKVVITPEHHEEHEEADGD